MSMSPQAYDFPFCARRELDHRRGDRLDVWLLWSESENRVSVAVLDALTREAFEIDVMEGERALDVFHHPFAYAASRRGRGAGEGGRRGLGRLRALVQGH